MELLQALLRDAYTHSNEVARARDAAVSRQMGYYRAYEAQEQKVLALKLQLRFQRDTVRRLRSGSATSGGVGGATESAEGTAAAVATEGAMEGDALRQAVLALERDAGLESLTQFNSWQRLDPALVKATVELQAAMQENGQLSARITQLEGGPDGAALLRQNERLMNALRAELLAISAQVEQQEQSVESEQMARAELEACNVELDTRLSDALEIARAAEERAAAAEARESESSARAKGHVALLTSEYEKVIGELLEKVGHTERTGTPSTSSPASVTSSARSPEAEIALARAEVARDELERVKQVRCLGEARARERRCARARCRVVEATTRRATHPSCPL